MTRTNARGIALSVFREAFVNKLRASILGNLKRYKEDESWVEEFADGSRWKLETPIELKAPLDLLDPIDRDLKDLENSIRLHKALFGLTPVQARDPRLWTSLGHVELWPYMRRRWDVEKYYHERDKAVRYVCQRYFVPQSQSRALLRNGVARLWWYANLTYDGDRDNPYELTAVLLSTLDITQQILERNLGRAQFVMRGFLEFLLRNSHELLSGGDDSRSKIRTLAKALNLYGGVCILDCLTQAEIMAFLEQEFKRLKK